MACGSLSFSVVSRASAGGLSRNKLFALEPSASPGTVRQYDIRLPNSQQNNIRSANVLLHSPNLKAERSQCWNPHKGSYFGRYFKYQGINSIRTNPVRPELIAVASQSPHVHVFDRRMCSLRTIQSDVTVSLSTGYAVAGHAEPIMQLKYPPRELLWQSSRPPELERDIRPSYVAWGSNGDKLLANYSSGPAVTWSTCLELCYNDQLSVNLVQEERLVTARLTGGSMYEVDEPGLVDSYWDTYKRTVPFDVERSMSDLARVQTGEGIVGTSRAGEDSLRSAKKLIAGLTLEELREVDANDVLRDIAQMFSVFVKERPDDLDLDKEFLWLLFGEYSLRVGPTLGANLLHSVAYPLASLNFEIAASFISQMVARQVWPLRFRGDPGCPDGEWMMGIDAMQEAETLLSLSRKLWVNRNFHSKRKERTIGARYERLFDEILEALFEEQELRPGTFDRGYWTGDDCREAFGFVLGHVEAGYIEAWVTYFARIGNGSVAESMLNTPIMLLGAQSRSFEQMYCYHSNENTDIKEAVFFGTDDSFVLCASDSGAVVAYDAMAEPVSYMESDSTIANCVRPHPYLPIIAWYVSSRPLGSTPSTHPHTRLASHSCSVHARHHALKLGNRRHREDLLTVFRHGRSRHHRRGPAVRVLVRLASPLDGNPVPRSSQSHSTFEHDRSPGRMTASVSVSPTLAVYR